jgi:UDP-GlcNAc:undecaprenyl-phosphate GlcNAc-1-phosphate transferase
MHLFVSFIVALSVTAVLIPPLSRWAPAFGLTDRPGPRKVHAVPVPRIGGIAMAIGMMAALLWGVEMRPDVSGLLTGLAVLLVFGIWDDRAELRYLPKLAGQLLAAVAVMHIADLRIDSLTIFSRESMPGWVSAPLTLLFLVGITNAVNLSDGLDGLAGGMVLLCLSAVALFAASSGNAAVVLIALSQGGAVLGFLRFNTFPARVFMGDAGSQVLGFTLGVLAILATQGSASVVSASLPLLLLGVPVLDTLLVMGRRLAEGRSPFSSDRLHLHHRLLGLGFPHRGAVAIIYLAQGAMILAAWFLRFESDLLVVGTFLALGASLVYVLGRAERSAWRWNSWLPDALGRSEGLVAVLPTVERLRPLVARASVVTMALGVLGYATAAIVIGPPAGADLGLLCILLLCLVAGLTIFPLPWDKNDRLDRPLAYFAVVLLVYLEESASGRQPAVIALSWTLLGVAGLAAVARFCVSASRQFEVTSLDVLVLFIALVMPNLPGTIEIPAGLTSGVAKTVVLLYVVEMLLLSSVGRRTPRIFLAAAIGGILVRSVASLAS